MRSPGAVPGGGHGSRILGGVLLLSAAWPLLSCRCESPTRLGDQVDQVEITIDPGTTYQVFEGFGTSINGWNETFRGYYERPEFHQLYLEQLGATVLRVDLSGEGVPERERWEDIAYADFALEGVGARAATYVRAAQQLTLASSGRLQVIASVWSPPAWMKVNRSKGNGHPARRNFALSAQDIGSPERHADGKRAADDEESRQRYLLSNKLRRDRYPHFAKSLVEWVRLYRSRGVELYALSPQNEPRFSHWFGSTVYSPEELAAVLEAIISMFEREGEPVPRLFAPETMMQDVAGNQAYLAALFASDKVRLHLHALAVHGYVDGYKADRDPQSPGRFFQLASRYGKPVWLTEGGTGGHDWPAPLHGLARSLVGAMIAGHTSLIAPWQVVDGPANEHGLMPISGPTKKTAIAGQFSRALQPGMVRIGATSADPDIEVLALADRASPGQARRVSLLLVSRAKQERRIRLRAARGQLTVVSAELTDRERSAVPLELGASVALTVPSESVMSARVTVAAVPGAPP